MSDTPKTDAFEALVNRPMDWWDWARQLERENADLHDTIDAVIEADERAVELWRAAHPGNELVVPDRARLVGWLLEQNAALRADKDRLDWMASADYWADIAVYRTPQALRAAIDSARKEAQP